MTSSKDYKRQIMNDLAGGDVESIDAKATQPEQEYANFDDFANRSSRSERRELFGRGFHPDRIPTSEMEPELRKAIAQIKPQQRDDVARALLGPHDAGVVGDDAPELTGRARERRRRPGRRRHHAHAVAPLRPEHSVR